MTIVKVQSKSVAGTLPYTVSLDDPPTPGNWLIAVASQADPTSYPVPTASGWSVVDNIGNCSIWSRIVAGHAGSAVYGSAMALDTKANIRIADGGGPFRKASHRFRARTSSAIDSVRFSQRGGPGYSSQNGNGGSMTISVQRDDGSGRPDGTPLASLTYSPANPVGAWTRYEACDFLTPYTTTVGELLHIVFANNSSSGSNYISINEIFCYDGPFTPRQPFDPADDYAVLVAEDGSSWGVVGKYTAVMDIAYADSSHDGQAYISNMVESPYFATISGSATAREHFTISGGDRIVSSVTVRMRRASGSGNLVATLKHGATVMDSGTIASGSVAISAAGGDNGGSVWVTATFGSPQTLVDGQTYDLVLSCAAGTTYTTAAIRTGEDQGFQSFSFTDGVGQRSSDGVTYADLYAFSPVDIQFYFSGSGGSADGADWDFDGGDVTPDGARITIYEVSGTLALNAHQIASGSSTAPQVVMTPTAGVAGFIVGVVGYDAAGPDASPLAGYTLTNDGAVGGGGAWVAALERIVTPTAGAYTIGATLGTTAGWNAVGAIFTEGSVPPATGGSGSTVTIVQTVTVQGTLPLTVTIAAPTPGNFLIAAMIEAQGNDETGGGFPLGSYPVSTDDDWHGVQNNQDVEIQYHVVVGGDGTAWHFDSHSVVGGTPSARVTIFEVSGIDSEWAEGTGGATSTAMQAVVDVGVGTGRDMFLVGAGTYAHATPSAVAVAGSTVDDDDLVEIPDGTSIGTVVHAIESAASGPYTIGATITSGAWLFAAGAFAGTAAPVDPWGGGGVGIGETAPGLWIDWADDGFPEGAYDNVTDWTQSLKYQRGAAPEITGAAQAATGTAILVNPDGLFSPDNSSSPLFGFLSDGHKVWFGCNEDGTLVLTEGLAVFGRFEGRVKDVTPIPAGGVNETPTVEITFEGALTYYGRQFVTIPPALGRSQKALRQAILDAIPETRYSLANEIGTMPISSVVNTDAFSALTAINAANGTRHFCEPSDVRDDWYLYRSFNRQHGLMDTPVFSLDADSAYVVGIDGWRLSPDTIINQQTASVDPISFPPDVALLWEAPKIPLTVDATTKPIEITFDDYVIDAVILKRDDPAGDAVTATIADHGTGITITLTAASSGKLTLFQVYGRKAQRGSPVVIKAENTSSIMTRGLRSGPDIASDYVGPEAEAQGICDHMIWRYGGRPLLRPQLTMANWLPGLDCDLFDLVSFSLIQTHSSGVIFEVLGLGEEWIMAPRDVAVPADFVYYKTILQLQERTNQTAESLFILDSSLLDGTDTLAY